MQDFHTLLVQAAEVTWFLVPAYAGNMAASVFGRFGWLPRLAYPIDFNLKTGTQPILGKNKTWRGVIVGTVAGALFGLGQYVVHLVLPDALSRIYNYSDVLFSIGLGALLGLGALVGDAAESWVKRRLGFLPGKPWPVADQVDMIVVGCGLLVCLVSWERLLGYVALAVIVTTLGGLLINATAVALKIKRSM